MKKLLVFVLTLSLLCGLCGSVALADRKIDSVALLVSLVNGEAQVTGSAVCVETDSGTRWITAQSALALGQPRYLMMEDSSYAFIESVNPIGTGLAAELTLGGTMGNRSVPLSTLSAHADSEPCIGYLSNAALLSTGASRIGTMAFPDGTQGLTCTSMEGLLPGAAIFDEGGALCGLITAALGEGEGRYTAVDAPALREMLGQAPAEKPAETPGENPGTKQAPAPAAGGTTWIESLPYRIEGTYLIVDFTGSDLLGQYIKIWYFDDGNDYYRWVVIEPGDEDPLAYFPAVPGRSLTLYAAANASAEAGDRDLTAAVQTGLTAGTRISVPEAKKEMPYGYQQECYLAATPKDQAVGDTERLPAAEEITRQLLTDEGTVLWFQVNCSYTVTEDLEDSLLTCLFAPDGSVTTNLSGFLYGVDFMSQDDWHVDVTDMVRYMDSLNGLPGGTYTFAYYVGDVLAGSFTFTLPGDTVEDGGDSI
ncbi:MAG: hypothetical protein IKS31_09825 [Clostridia bacterium]|nr:hypothetical protein [Clostridia bacterium]